MKWLANVVLLIPFATFGQEPAISGVIAGTVVNATSNAPMPRVLVVISPIEVTSAPRRIQMPRSEDRFAITEGDGRFAFLNVPPGKYRLTAARPNDRPQAFLQEGQYSTSVVVGSGVDTTTLVFPYHLPGSIHGSVSDEKGEGIRNAQVVLFVREVVDGELRIHQAGITHTRAGGSFHVGHLAAGEYFVAVTARPWFQQYGLPTRPGVTVNNDSQLDTAYPLTYYPGVTDFAGATPIRVSDGGTATAQIVLHAVPALHVQIAGSGDQSPQNLSVGAVAIGPAGQPMPSSFSVGGGMLYGVAPGRYRINIQGQQPLAMKTMDLTGNGPVDMSSGAGISVSGKVTIEGPDKPTNRMMVFLSDSENGPHSAANVGDDGRFVFDRVAIMPGRYRVSMPNNPAFFVKSVSVKGAKFESGTLELVDGSSAELSLVIAPNAQRKITGYALRNERPVAGAMVLLVPVARGQENLIRRDQSDLDGSFQLNGIAPGQYGLIAIDDGRDLPYRDPAAIQPYVAGATPLTVNAGSADAGDLRVTVQSRVR